MSVHAAPGPQIPSAPRDGRAQVALPGSRPGRRLLAHLIDLVLVAALGAVVYLPTGSVLLAAVVAAELAVGLAVWEARSGRTLGKQLLGVRAAQIKADYAPGLRRGMIRSALLAASHSLALIGQFLLIATSAFDRTGRGQAWHDRVAGTRVVDVRAGATAPTPTYAPAPGKASGFGSRAPAQSPAPVPGVPAAGPVPGAPGAGPPPGLPGAAPAPGTPQFGPAPAAPGAVSEPPMPGHGPGPGVPGYGSASAAPGHGPAPGAPGPATGPGSATRLGPATQGPGHASPAPPSPASRVPSAGSPASLSAGSPASPPAGPASSSPPIPGAAPPPPVAQGAPSARTTSLPPTSGPSAPPAPAGPSIAPDPPGPGRGASSSRGSQPGQPFNPAAHSPNRPGRPATPGTAGPETAGPGTAGPVPAASRTPGSPSDAVDPRTLDPAEMSDLHDLRDAAHGGAVFVLTLDDGKSVTVSGAGLIGRRPQPRPGEHVAHLVAVDDPGRSLSRTHAAFGIDGEDLWVEDRGSANGTVVVSAAGASTRVFPGKRVAVPEDGRINLGERSVSVQRWYA